MHIEIDNKSGFCFGVQRAINKVEELIQEGEQVHCLGDIVHNHEEVMRLSQLGMHTIQTNDLAHTSRQTVLVRSHGEPPSTFEKLKTNQNKTIDATCPVVSKLQNRIKKSYGQSSQKNGQLVIYGKKEHPEVIGLNGQTGNQAIVVTNSNDLEEIDFTRPIEIYSQTTMPLDGFEAITKQIKEQATNEVIVHDTICRQVAGRVPHLKIFVKKFDVVLFVSGKKSSNGKSLFEVCRKSNPNTYFISSPNEVNAKWIENADKIGICGATSTPQWLMEKVKEHIENNEHK
ncbi:MAG: 4-hydroxy-3-methylbut-2-enyl diphosphate reductase [Prolixibacteraceae bacterium]|nr:4-hydroxy-3-methylbut-2-enyl diphosphate reductase [Prolixibacteraceae bacterium]MBN2650648.1 4-hydroxy-3-methylbut-2-enyl diphosphate reductase [Prolixibacteraceae bacterium]